MRPCRHGLVTPRCAGTGARAASGLDRARLHADGSTWPALPRSADQARMLAQSLGSRAPAALAVQAELAEFDAPEWWRRSRSLRPSTRGHNASSFSRPRSAGDAHAVGRAVREQCPRTVLPGAGSCTALEVGARSHRHLTDIYAERPLRDHGLYCWPKRRGMATSRCAGTRAEVRFNAVARARSCGRERNQRRQAAGHPRAHAAGADWTPDEIAKRPLAVARASYSTGQICVSMAGVCSTRDGATFWSPDLPGCCRVVSGMCSGASSALQRRCVAQGFGANACSKRDAWKPAGFVRHRIRYRAAE